MGIRLWVAVAVMVGVCGVGNPAVDWMLEAQEPQSQKQFKGKTLMFTTPWNPQGDVLVQKYAHKIDYYSPCVLDLVMRGGKVAIEGEESYSQRSVSFQSLKDKHPEIKILPRLYIPGDKIDIIKALGGSRPVFNGFLDVVERLAKDPLTDGFVWDTPFNVFTKEAKWVQVGLLMKQVISQLKPRLRGKLLLVNIANPTIDNFNFELFQALKTDGFLIQNYGEGGYLGSILNTIDFLQKARLKDKQVFFMLPFFSRKNKQHLINSEAVKQVVTANGYFDATFEEICRIDSNGDVYEIPCPEYFEAAFKMIQPHNVGFWEAGNGLEEYFSYI